MGFPSPAADYAESRISLDQQIIRHPSATYFMRAADSHHREGILQGALLVVDSSLTPVDGSLLVCALDGEYRDIAHPINSDTGDRIQKLILEKYQETMAVEE